MTPSKLADELIALDPHERRAILATLGPHQRRALRPYWRVWAHEGQLAPAGEWHTWLIMAGRAIIYLSEQRACANQMADRPAFFLNYR